MALIEMDSRHILVRNTTQYSLPLNHFSIGARDNTTHLDLFNLRIPISTNIPPGGTAGILAEGSYRGNLPDEPIIINLRGIKIFPMWHGIEYRLTTGEGEMISSACIVDQAHASKIHNKKHVLKTENKFQRGAAKNPRSNLHSANKSRGTRDKDREASPSGRESGTGVSQFLQNSLSYFKIEIVEMTGESVSIRNVTNTDHTIANHTVKQVSGGSVVAEYRIPDNIFIKAGGGLTIWSEWGWRRWGLQSTPSDLRWGSLHKIPIWLGLTTVLCNPSGRGIAWCTFMPQAVKPSMNNRDTAVTSI